MNNFIVVVIVVAFLLSAGCTAENQKPVVTPAPQTIYITVPVPPTLTQMITTAAPTPAPVTHTTTLPATRLPDAAACPTYLGSKPVSRTINLNGTGDSLVFFETAAPGKVKFSVSASKVTGCTDDQMGFKLAGTSTCNSLERTFSIGATTIDVPGGGKYSIMVRGCKNWRITINNG